MRARTEHELSKELSMNGVVRIGNVEKSPASRRRCQAIKIASIRAFVIALVIVPTLLLTGCGPDAQTKEEQLYSCGMHPQVIQNKPGNCPICGMKLTPVRKQSGPTGGTNDMAQADSSTLTVD